jgi:hypothetical protein
MAKHPHQLLLVNKKTWKCVKDGCAFFVHLGLAHVLVGKQGICWDCGGIFTVNEISLQDDKPICDECRIGTPVEVLEHYMRERGVIKDDE